MPYNPDAPPSAADWLSRDEGARVDQVLDYHRNHKITVANERLHAAIHVVVETQVAAGEPVVVETMARLEREGLSRHEAMHAVGSVLADRIVAALRAKTPKPALADGYLEDLKALSAAGWKAT
jgi:hypothetical protein